MASRSGSKLALVVALCACRHDPPASDHTVPLRVDGEPATTLTIPPSGLDLLEQCAALHALEFVIRGKGGTFLEGACAVRDRHALIITGSGAELRARGQGGPPIGRLDSIDVVEVWTQPATAAKSVDLSIVIDGETHTMTAAELSKLARRRGETSVVDLLGALGIKLRDVRGLRVIGEGEPYAIDPAWLLRPDDSLAVRHNQRGALRFGHSRNNVELARVSAVRTLEITTR
jgi:hypothetical protein